MDLANAALLVAAVLGIASLAKSLAFGTTRERLITVIVIGVGFAATFLVGATTWAHTQVIGGVEMAHMRVGDKVLVALFAAGAASAAWETLTAFKNIGVPMPTKAQAEALDTGALRSMELWAAAQHPDEEEDVTIVPRPPVFPKR